MKDWKKFWGSFWNTYPAKARTTDYLKQVGKTVNGAPISQKQFDTIIADITNLLSIKHDDVILDLCCGNGLITREIASRCRQVVGVDFSQWLIQRANESTPNTNVRYVHLDVRDIRKLSSDYPGYFTKVLWYEALAFFNTQDLEEILNALTILTRNDAVILIGSVLDHQRKWNFFNTFQRKLFYLVKIMLLGQEVGLGKWWRRKEIINVCEKTGYKCEFYDQSEILHTSHYRIDVKLTPLTGRVET